jgi:hypothetical protein
MFFAEPRDTAAEGRKLTGPHSNLAATQSVNTTSMALEIGA